MPTENSSAEKQQLHQLVDSLPSDQVPAVLRYIKYLSTDPVLLSLLNAPEDDEPYTDEQRQNDAAAEDSIAGGEGIPHEDILHEFGL